MSGTESDGAPQPGIGQPAAEIEPWYANRAPVEAHPTWYQPVRVVGQRRRGRALAAAGAAAAVVIGGVAVAVIGLPRFNFLHAGSPPKPSPPLTAAQVVLLASRQSGRLNWVSATINEEQRGPRLDTTGTVTEQRNPLLLSMKLNDSKGHTRISARLTADAIYIYGSSTGMPAALARKWIKIPFGEMGSGSAAATLTTSLRYLNPVPQAQLLIAAQHVRAAGTASVGRVTTTKYTGWFTPSAAAKHLSASLRRALWPVLKHISGNVGFKVWIDGQHRIRQLTEVEHWGGTVTFTSRFSGFNVPVHITLPTASEVVTLPASAVSGTGTKIRS